ncbi:ZYRO0D14454p [Zygosaccharomyces rouxii]|uniref:ZYRO0D14454p n=1 Tax=Zygosaccharomyces rouxii (strain ATCC 2623 / CBS 732 / NBRC 1130 / NCYC 568 / NRRL Y-229) TaxID=559307 RepID=C5DWF6_ZYGRC|nr:uncharacterized protein ZYRO0D14454g [Zygosaccharomyces rouxii]CAR28125.1 ZYRO0D14454p [Zygosaccharomyces rouxii]
MYVEMKSRITSRSEDNGRIFVITINDPKKLNSLSFQDFKSIGQLLQVADNDPQVQVTVLQSTGKFFSAGVRFEDIGYMRDDVSSHPERLFGHIAMPNIQLVAQFTQQRKPLVCCLNGPAVGMTAALVMLCDIIYAKNDSAYLLFPFANLGFVPEGGTSVTLPWKLGINSAYEHLVMGSPITVQELIDARAVSKVYYLVDTNTFNDKIVSEIAKTISNVFPESLLGVKGQLNANLENNLLARAQSLETNTTMPFWTSGEPFKRFQQLQEGTRRHKL